MLNFRGFMKYEREKSAYRNAKTRQNDWNEIYDFKNVRKGLKKQAARFVTKLFFL